MTVSEKKRSSQICAQIKVTELPVQEGYFWLMKKKSAALMPFTYCCKMFSLRNLSESKFVYIFNDELTGLKSEV